MLNEILSQFGDLLPKLLMGLAIVLGGLAFILLKNLIKNIKGDAKQSMAFTVVAWVAQKFENLSNEHKFDKAYERISELTKRKLSHDEIEMLIESSVAVIKNGAQKEAKKNIDLSTLPPTP